ncbi:MAG: leucine-rich repeat protein [Clostridia bacterium]|nr:leucine-rich repeat protein [Clostridia bacterium]
MKRKLLFIFLGALIFTCLFATAVFADVNYNETAILADGTELPIYDENNNPLIWYVSGIDGNGNNTYASVPNNRNEANASNDTYVTYASSTGTWASLNDIYIHIYDPSTGEYVKNSDDNMQIVVLNLREFDMIYLGSINVSHIQYMYYPATLKDCPDKFKNQSALRLVDMSVCENLVGGFGGNQNFRGCSNLHTVRLATGTEYTLACNINYNYRFMSTAITTIVIPSNITSIGVDNFNSCTKLESIYIMGNQTSLGKRNFDNCPSLERIYILGDNPTIDVTSFKENFYQCVDGNKTYDFTGVGKYFYFVTENIEYLTQVKDAIGATGIVSYDDYIASPASYTEGRYIISGTSICDEYYGEHAELVEIENNTCQGICSRCNQAQPLSEPVHKNVLSESFVGEKYFSSVNLLGKCENCSEVALEESLAPIFYWVGYSAKTFGDGKGFGQQYVINRDALEKYQEIMTAYGKKFSYGVVAAGASSQGQPLEVIEGVATAKTGAQSICFDQLTYDAFFMNIVGIDNANLDTSLVCCAYVQLGDEIVYLDNNQAKDTAGFLTYNIVAGLPETKGDEE